ncbi:hypothetical protein A605_11070 [Corynebacterium halotolerans YIM 70093 = DSM 44683]|uniref:Uncharacterized protein n=1 Tax=Corynebacterium halotolerans YIM 70093 = DSM 44683 TaxID=1121362 RepID=M1MZS1_9CORY|nr:hypothetical protein A605_11070 [Corynebacterium halotolerans YIM 70093 = DSM 44683]
MDAVGHAHLQAGVELVTGTPGAKPWTVRSQAGLTGIPELGSEGPTKHRDLPAASQKTTMEIGIRNADKRWSP